MKVETLIVGNLSTNCYLVYSDQKVIIVDPGDDTDFIIRKIKDLELEPQAIIATHGHFDHVLAVTELKLAFKIPFYIHKDDEFLLKRMSQTSKYFTGFDPGPAPKPDNFLKENLKIGKDIFKVIPTPGHTSGSISLYAKGLVFVGDLLFSGGGVGRTDLAGGSKELLNISIKKIIKLPKDTIIYPGHGGETTIAELQSYFST